MFITKNLLNQHIFSKLKLRTQVLIFQVIIQIIIGTLLAVISYLTFQWIVNMFLDVSRRLYVQEYYRKTDMISYLQIKSSKEVLLRSQNHLIKSDNLYQFLQKVHNLEVQQPLNCLNYADPGDQYQYQQTFCYGFFGDETYPITQKDQLAMNYSAILTECLPIMDMDLDLLYSTVGDQMYFSIWPGDPFPNYKPHRRIWYTNHLQQIADKNYNLTYFSDPYILWTWLIFMITQTRNLTNINGSLDGVFGSDLNFSLFHTLSVKQENVSFSIIDQSGMYLLSQLDLSSEYYLYDTNISGFNQEDYQQINNSLNQVAFQNNCTKIGSLYQNERLCRYNSKSKTEEMIVVNYLDPTNLILLIQVDLLEKELELTTQLSNFYASFQSSYYSFIYISVITISVSMVLSSIIIYITLSPITNLILFTSQQIYKEADLMQQQVHQKVHLKHTKNSAGTIKNLHQAFRKMNQALTYSKRGKRNHQCTELETINYPTKNVEQHGIKTLHLKDHSYNQFKIFKPFQYLKLKFLKRWLTYI